MKKAPKKLQSRPKPGRSLTDSARKIRQKKADATRDTEVRRLYDKSWTNHARRLRSEYPGCALCFERGILTPAAVVDHWVPHRGDEGLFWARNNHIPLCKACHDGPKRRLELGMDRHGELRSPPPLVTPAMITEFLTNERPKQ